jgi:hypothetical protein
MDFTDDGAAVKKRMLRDREFQAIAAGGNEGTNITGSAVGVNILSLKNTNTPENYQTRNNPFFNQNQVENRDYKIGFVDGYKKLLSSASQSHKEENKRNWIEDFSHENGNYQNECNTCNEMFFGHKRRVICKLSWGKS